MRGLLYLGAPAEIGALFVVFFFILFAALVYAVYRKGIRKEMDRGALLPLNDE
jgi:cbb3-type cytochrome oxidase subunit 3